MVFDLFDASAGIYDNMKTAVETISIFLGKDRPLQSSLPADVQSYGDSALNSLSNRSYGVTVTVH